MISNIKSLCRLVLAVSALSLVFSLNVYGAPKAYINGTNVNVRAGDSTDHDVLGKLNKREQLTVTGKSGSFVQIIHNGGEAYVSAEFVAFESDDAFVNSDNVSIRVNRGNETAGQLNSGDVITVTGRYKEFLVFDFGGEIGYVHKDNVDSLFKDFLPEIDDSKLPVTYAKVISDSSLNLRQEPTVEADILSKLPSGDILDVVEKGSEWTKVRTHDEKIGYVSTEFVEVKNGVKPERPAASRGKEIISYAKQFIGTPYRYGGTNLSSGVDCSGFVYSVFRNFGITLNRTSSSMPANGNKIGKSELVAGDLVFFSNGGGKNIQHVGIYCGDGTFIHSSSGGNMRVMISGMGEDYYVRNYITAARVLN